MKKLLLLTSLCLASLQSFATDLFVRENGVGGAFPTISEAITAAVDGDRIIIEPKAGGIPYFEDVIIDKSLTLQSSISGERYIINGTINFEGTNNRTIIINNAAITGEISMDNDVPDGDRMNVTITNSSAEAVLLNFNNVSIILANSEIEDLVHFTHGKIINNIFSSLILTSDFTNTPSNDPIYIIANSSTTSNIQKYIIASNNYGVRIYNNTLIGGISGGTNRSMIRINNAQINSINFIQNNNIIYTSGSGDPVNGILINVSVPASNWDIRNNAFDKGTLGSTYEAIDDNSVAGDSQAFFNLQRGGGTDFSVDAEASNGVYFTDSGLVDAGHPGQDFFDIDLTINDVGVNGGSFSQLNYATPNPETLPQVFFVNIPRRVTTGTAIDVQAIGTTN